MRHIRKGGQPGELIQWDKANREGPNYEYGQAQFPKSEVLDALLQEQGYLCAYTMRRVSADTAHVEHLKPQETCRKERSGEDVAYANMVACFPKNGGDKSYGYGAPVKADWWEPALFLSPLDPTCEQRLHFIKDGSVHPTDANDPAATKTIEMLGLDDGKLREDRLSAFRGRGVLPSSPKPLSEAGLKRLIQELDGADPVGRELPEYYTALRQVAGVSLKMLQAIKKKRKFETKR